MSDPEVAEEHGKVAAKQPLQYVVRFGALRTLGVMASRQPCRYGDEVVARTNRGTETGSVLCEATPVAMDAMEEPTHGRIIRRLSDDDRSRQVRLESETAKDLVTCQKCVDALKLSMELVDVERLLGGERVIVYFLAEGRIDFRQLVRDLAKQFQTRIEMRQIGVRDEAKLLADYGDCGQPICCANFLSKMPPVSMKMAKLQKATLDPNKISGRCGRLKCCLRYEFETYEEYRPELPNSRSIILTKEGQGKVLAQEILARKVLVEFEGGRRTLVDLADVMTVVSTRGGGRKKDKPESSSDGKRDRSGGKRNRDPSRGKSEGDRPNQASIVEPASEEPATGDGDSSENGSADSHAKSQS